MNIWGPRYPGITADVECRKLSEVCALQWQFSVETAWADLTKLPQDRVFTIKYESLVSDSSTVGELAEGLKLDSSSIVKHWDATVVPKPARTIDRSQAATISEIEAVIAKTLSDFGY